MNTLIIYMDSQGNITPLTMSEPMTYMFIGLLFFAIACGSTLVPDSKKQVIISMILGVVSFIISITLYFYN